VQAESSALKEKAARVRPARRNLVRAAMLQAAQALMAEGRSPSVPEVADHAGIARATAYRQFSSAEALMNEAALDRIAAEIPAVMPQGTAGSPEEAVEALVRRVFGMVVANDPAFRTMLRLSLEDAEARRGGRRLDWAREALAPFAARFGAGALERLVPALALTLGIETWVTLRNVCGLARAEAEEVAVWTARALVERALREGSAGAATEP
jgi:AcrR family transcriptional regulator